MTNAGTPKAPDPDFVAAVDAYDLAAFRFAQCSDGRVPEAREKYASARSALLAQHEALQAEVERKMRDAFEEIKSRICTWRDTEPEKNRDGETDESWESWFYAAFDLLRIDVAEIARSALSQATGTEGKS